MRLLQVLAEQTELVRVLSKSRSLNASATKQPDHVINKMSIPGGYACHAMTWIGTGRTVTLFDTGATQNSISGKYFKALTKDDKTVDSIIECGELEKRVKIGGFHDKGKDCVFADVGVILAVTFRESSSGPSKHQWVTKNLKFLVIPGMRETMLLGKPDLDKLGFTSNKHYITIHEEGLSFPTLQPHELPDSDNKIMQMTDACMAPMR